MTTRFFRIFNKEFDKLHEAAYLLGIFSLMSQVLGLFRDRLLAHTFGASHALDLYYAAFRIPDFLFVSVASFASATVIIPFFAERKNESAAAARKFINDIFTIFFASMAAVSLAVFFVMPILAPLVIPGFSAADQETLVAMSRILLLSPFLLGLSNFLGSVTQSVNKFFVFAFSPVLYNAGIIAGIVLFTPSSGAYGVIAGVVLGAFLHLAIQLPVVSKEGFLPKFSRSIDWAGARRVILLSLPRTVALSVGNIAILFLITFASYISEGSISVFQLALNLQSVPLSIIGVSYSVAAFPALSALFAKGEIEKFRNQIMNAASHIVFWSLPVVFLFIVLRAQIVRVILGSGRFNWNDTRLTAAALAVFLLSLVAQSLVLLFTRGYYAAGKTKKPLVANTVSAAAIVFLAFVFSKSFSEGEGVRYFFESALRIQGVPGAGVIMLPLAYSLGMTANAIFLWWRFDRDFGGASSDVLRAFRQSLVASFMSGIAAFFALQTFEPAFSHNTFLGVLLHGAVSGIIGIAVLILTLTVLKNPEWNVVKTALREKIWKDASVSTPGIEEMQ